MLRIVNRLRIFAYVAMVTSHLALYGLMPERHLDTIVISLAVNLVFVFVFAPFFTKWMFSYDIQRIQKFVNSLKIGDMEGRLPVKYGSPIDIDFSELNELHQSMNWMADQIVKREQLIKKQLAQAEEREQKLTDMVVRDPMTQLYNRQYFQETVNQAVAELKRHKRPFALAILDVDHFKKINDTHGHLMGDTVLLSLSDLLHQLVRKEDIVARLGGEEFGILLKEADTQSVEQTLQRIHQSIDSMEVPLDDGRTLTITVSIGYSAAHYEHDHTHDELFHKADMALYHVKNSGRNGIQKWHN